VCGVVASFESGFCLQFSLFDSELIQRNQTEIETVQRCMDQTLMHPSSKTNRPLGLLVVLFRFGFSDYAVPDSKEWPRPTCRKTPPLAVHGLIIKIPGEARTGALITRPVVGRVRANQALGGRGSLRALTFVFKKKVKRFFLLKNFIRSFSDCLQTLLNKLFSAVVKFTACLRVQFGTMPIPFCSSLTLSTLCLAR